MPFFNLDITSTLQLLHETNKSDCRKLRNAIAIYPVKSYDWLKMQQNRVKHHVILILTTIYVFIKDHKLFEVL